MRKYRKKKEKDKNVLISILILTVLLVGTYFAGYFGLLDNVLKNFSVSELIKNNLPKPKLKIIDEESNSRVIAVMINNNHVAWPHSGLQDAFLNYEIVVEGGITRIMSLFKDKDTSRIGSVRSARHYFLDYALENDAIFVHFGHSQKALKDIKSLKVNNINGMYDSKGFFRDKKLKKSYEHTAFTTMSKINSVIKSKKYRTTSEEDSLLNYSIIPVYLAKQTNSIKADKVYIEYSGYTNTSYVYNPEDELYYRSMSGKKHVDYVTKKQYTTTNIITYQVKNYSFDSYGRQDLKNVGTGTGYYISRGYAVPIMWEKESRNDKTIYKYLSGKEINVNDGVTWIQIQPKGKTLKIENTTKE